MKEDKLNRLISRLYLIAAIAVLLGAFFKLQHYPYGSALFFGGLIVGAVTSFIHISGLKKTIKTLEEKESKG
jgi:hypothetical protein